MTAAERIIAVAGAEPPARGSPDGRARIVSAGMLGALGIVGQLVEPDLWSENPAYGTQVSLGRMGWLAACCLAAVIVRSDWRGFLAAWLGALVALMPVAPMTLGHSPTTAGDPFWISMSIAVMAVYAMVILGVAFGVTRAVEAIASPRRAHRILIGLLGLMLVVSIALLVIPPGPNTGPQPAPTAPPG